MKLEDYKSGEYKQGVGYKAFLPSRINHNWGWGDTKLDYLLAEANRQIGELMKDFPFAIDYLKKYIKYY